VSLDDSNNDYPFIKNDTSVINRPAADNQHSGSQTNVTVITRKNYHDSDPRGRVGSNQTTDLYSFTAFFVYLPIVNADASGLSNSTNNSSTATNTTFLYSSSAHLAISDLGVWKAKSNGQSEIPVVLSGSSDVMAAAANTKPIQQQKWDINYYLSGAASNGQGKLVKEPIIWCVDLINNKANLTLSDHRSYRTQQSPKIKKEDRIDDHTTWWHSYIDGLDVYNYTEAIPASYDVTAPGGIWVYNQYGVLVGWEAAQTNGVGREAMRFGNIGVTGGSSATQNLSGLHCETIVCPTPMSMARKHLMLKHLRTKWGIADSYANGKPFHD